MNITLINKKAVKEQTLKCAIEVGKSELTRVSADFLDRANVALNDWITNELKNHPVDGKTVR